MIEQWIIIDYGDIIKNKYEISNIGNVKNIQTGRILFGNNPNNEKGYKRVCLQTYDKPKKYAVHRLVLYMFSEHPDDTLEGNHIDGSSHGKLTNTIYNLEYATRLENAHHASVNQLYSSCEDHHKSVFTNDQVQLICQYLSKGVSMNVIIKKMNLEDIKYIKTYISRIKDRKTWIYVSKDYQWNSDIVIYKTYSKIDIEKMCEYLFIYQYKIKQIIPIFKQYDSNKLKNILKKIKQKKLYCSISNKYINQDKSSTTIERDPNKYYININ